ncbi:[Fe-S]-binding protein, partial [Desulfobacteraceae bacterium SEEP-SAG9]
MNRNNKGWVRTVCLTPPTLQDNTADADRLADALKSELKTNRVDIDLDLLKKLPEQLRKWAYQLQCVVLKDRDRWFLTDITDSRDSCTIAGLAVDLGTSRVVLRLLNLSNGQILNESSFHNPQVTIAS